MVQKKILLLLLMLSGLAAALTTNATITIKDPNGVVVVSNAQMACVFQGYTTGVSFDSPTACGFNTTSPTLINRTNVSCTYTFEKNYSVDGNWVANVTFYHTGYENKGVGIITTNGTVDPKTPIDTASPPTGQMTNDCTGNTTCTSDPQCNNSVNESVSWTLYTINRDAVQADCLGYGGKWYPSVTGGSNYYCCGDDGASDNFYYWSGATCMYCNNGVNSSSTTKCTSPSSYCYGYNDAACQSGDANYCCYGVSCSSTGATTGYATNIVGGNCTCTGGICAWPVGNGYCINMSWGGAGCYSGVYCTATGWNFSRLDSPPNNAANAGASPSTGADPETAINVSANVSDRAPVTGNLTIKVYKSTASSPDDVVLCTGNSVVTGNVSWCTFTASSAGCSPGNCTVKILVYEVDYDPCGDHKYSFNFTNVSFLYWNRNVSPPILNAPTTDPNISMGGTFVLNCTPVTGNASTGINMSFQFNSTLSDWASISSSGGLTTTQANPVVDVLNGTAYAINVTGAEAGTYWVHCQAYNSSDSVNSSAQKITVIGIPTQLSQSASPPSPSYYGTNITFSCNYSNQSDNTPLTGAAVYVNLNGVDYQATYSNGNYTYWNNTLPDGNNQWYCKASKSGYDPQVGSREIYTISTPLVNTSLTSYPNCGAVFYRVSLYDANSKLIDSYFSLKVIDPSTITVLTQAALYPNNGTGVYLGSYLLNTTSALGTWLLKVTESSGVTVGKNFGVTNKTFCGKNTTACPSDYCYSTTVRCFYPPSASCDIPYVGDSCTSCIACIPSCSSCSGFCEAGACYTCSGNYGTCPSGKTCCNCGAICSGQPVMGYSCVTGSTCDKPACGCP